MENKDFDETPDQILNRKRLVEILNNEQIDRPKSNNSKPYTLNDSIISKKVVGSNLHVKLLKNERGYFVDLRRYDFGKPSKYGVRLSARNFKIACDYLKEDLKAVLNK